MYSSCISDNLIAGQMSGIFYRNVFLFPVFKDNQSCIKIAVESKNSNIFGVLSNLFVVL